MYVFQCFSMFTRFQIFMKWLLTKVENNTSYICVHYQPMISMTVQIIMFRYYLAQTKCLCCDGSQMWLEGQGAEDMCLSPGGLVNLSGCTHTILTWPGPCNFNYGVHYLFSKCSVRISNSENKLMWVSCFSQNFLPPHKFLGFRSVRRPASGV